MKVENTDVTSRRLKETRETRRMTLQEVSDMTGFSTSVLSRYENGHIEKLSCERLSIIAKALNVSPVWLMGFDESNSEPSENEYMLDTIEREIIETYRKADGRQKMRIGAVVSEIADVIEKNHSETNGGGKVG